MHLIIAPNSEGFNTLAADIVEQRVTAAPSLCLGTVTGASPEGMYRELARRHAENGLDFSRIRTINTDEYLGLPGTHPQSYRFYLERKFFRPCGIPLRHTAVPAGDAENALEECARYEAFCRAHPADLQILGIGHTGHIGFNEPEDFFADKTHIVALQQETIKANSVYFSDGEKVPTQAITVGIGTLMRAKEILLLICGGSKAEVTYKLLCGPVTPGVPGTILRFHRNVTAIIDEDAIALVRDREPETLKEYLSSNEGLGKDGEA